MAIKVQHIILQHPFRTAFIAATTAAAVFFLTDSREFLECTAGCTIKHYNALGSVVLSSGVGMVTYALILIALLFLRRIRRKK